MSVLSILAILVFYVAEKEYERFGSSVAFQSECVSSVYSVSFIFYHLSVLMQTRIWCVNNDVCALAG